MNPRVVLIDEPTQGVDVRSRLDIYRFLRAIADSGSAVVVVSSDASELAGLCDRILVMSRGRLTSELAGSTATEESIVGAFAVEHELAADADEPDQATAVAPRVRRSWLRRHVTAEGIRLIALVAMMVGLALFAQSRNDTFLTEFGIYNVLLVALPLVAVAAAQYFVLLVGGIDVSVGAVMTLSVVLLSSWADTGSTGRVLVMSAAVVVVLGVCVGFANAFLVERIGLSPVIATIATLGVVSGIAYIMRPTAAGLISPDLADLLMLRKVGPVPVALIVLLVLWSWPTSCSGVPAPASGSAPSASTGRTPPGSASAPAGSAPSATSPAPPWPPPPACCWPPRSASATPTPATPSPCWRSPLPSSVAPPSPEATAPWSARPSAPGSSSCRRAW